jgi:hypothetical protein
MIEIFWSLSMWQLKFSVIVSLVIKNFGHHMLGNQKNLIAKPVMAEKFWSSSLQQLKVIEIHFH